MSGNKRRLGVGLNVLVGEDVVYVSIKEGISAYRSGEGVSRLDFWSMVREWMFLLRGSEDVGLTRSRRARILPGVLCGPLLFARSWAYPYARRDMQSARWYMAPRLFRVGWEELLRIIAAMTLHHLNHFYIMCAVDTAETT